MGKNSFFWTIQKLCCDFRMLMTVTLSWYARRTKWLTSLALWPLRKGPIDQSRNGSKAFDTFFQRLSPFFPLVFYSSFSSDISDWLLDDLRYLCGNTRVETFSLQAFVHSYKISLPFLASYILLEDGVRNEKGTGVITGVTTLASFLPLNLNKIKSPDICIKETKTKNFLANLFHRGVLTGSEADEG